MHSIFQPAPLLLLALSWHPVVAETPVPHATLPPISESHFADTVRPLLQRYCGDCHEPGDKEGVDFLTADSLSGFKLQRGLFASVAQQLENRTMPPEDAEQPTDQHRTEMTTWIKHALRATACDQEAYAPVILSRRLNRTEYQNTLRDLTGHIFDVSDTFPVDGSGGEGFDNNGETLFLPPMLMERYLETATLVLDQAIVSPPQVIEFSATQLIRTEDVKSAGVTCDIYQPGKFSLVLDFGNPENDLGEHATVDLEVDGLVTQKIPWGTLDGSGHYETSIPFSRGNHVIRVVSGDVAQPGAYVDRLAGVRLKQLASVVSDDRSRSHRMLLAYGPGQRPRWSTAASARAFARQQLVRFATRSFRRPPDESQISALLAIYDRAAARNDPFEECMKLAMKAALLSPHSLFRIEPMPVSEAMESLDSYSMATRLSYFLWSSMPDDPLLSAADENRLHRDDELIAWMDRLLADPRSVDFCRSFMGQWLGTREVGRLAAPAVEKYREQFSTPLLVDLRQEPVEFMRYMIAENRSVLDFLDASYSLHNERLVQHYQLKSGDTFPDFKKDKGTRGAFERHPWALAERHGLLGMGAVHLVASSRDRTSPVLRGAWVLESLLGVRIPPPPADVPEIKHNKKSTKTLREKLAQHRADPACASCHNLMDPIGFSLENYDLLGRWRDEDAGHPIDNQATMPNGHAFNGPDGLRDILLARRDEFVHHLARKMLGYALGRSLSDRDDCVVQQVANATIADGYRIRTMIREIVLSDPFRRQQIDSPSDGQNPIN